MNIFISYSRANRAQVEPLEQMLRALGNNVWYDRDISAGDEWWRAIITQIRQSDIFVFALSPQSTASPACQAEYSYARALNKPILPILLKEAELPEGSLTEIQYVDARNLHANTTTLSLSRAMLNLQSRILAGEFRPPTVAPTPPPIPHQVDPLMDARRTITNLQDAKSEALAHTIYSIKQVVRENRHLTTEARALLTTIIDSPYVSQGIAAEARDTLRTLPGHQRSSLPLVGGVMALVALIAVVLFLSLPGNRPPVIPTETGASGTTGSTATGMQASASPSDTTETRTATTVAIAQVPTDSATDEVTVEVTEETNTPTRTRTPRSTVTPSPTDSPTPTATMPTFASDNYAHITELSASPLIAHQVDTAVRSIAFSGDGRLMASGGMDTFVTLWDTATWSSLGTFSPGSSAVNGIALSPDGTYLAVGLANRTFEVYTLDERRLLTFNGRHNNQVNDVQFSPDGALLATGSADGTIELWSVPSGDSVRTIIHSRDSGVLQIAFSPDGRLLASSGADGIINLWEIATGLKLESATIIEDEVIERGDNVRLNGLAFGGNSRAIAVTVGGTDGDGYVRVWDSGRDDINVGTGLSDRLLSDIDAIGGGSAFISASGNGLLTFYDQFGVGLHRIDLRRNPFNIPSLEAVVMAVAASPTEPILALGMRNGRIRIIGVE